MGAAPTLDAMIGGGSALYEAEGRLDPLSLDAGERGGGAWGRSLDARGERTEGGGDGETQREMGERHEESAIEEEEEGEGENGRAAVVRLERGRGKEVQRLVGGNEEVLGGGERTAVVCRGGGERGEAGGGGGRRNLTDLRVAAAGGCWHCTRMR